MILFTNIASVVIDNVKNCLHVSGEITDTVTNKVFSFRGKATVMDATDQPGALNVLKQIQEQTDSEKWIVTEAPSLKEQETKPAPKMTYDNLWKF